MKKLKSILTTNLYTKKTMTGKFMIAYESSTRDESVFDTIEEARVLFEKVVASGLYEWVQIRDMDSDEEFVEEWINPDYFSEENFYEHCQDEGIFMMDECSREEVQKAIDAVAETYSTSTHYDEAKELAKTFYDDYDMGVKLFLI